MDFEELKEQVKELKAQGLSDEDILNIFFEGFASGEIEAEDLEKMAGAIGYKFSPQFEQELAKQGGEEPNGEGLTPEVVEETKEIGENETPEEFEEKIEDINSEKEDAEETEDEPEDEDDEEEDEDDGEDEEEKAMKMFGLKK